MSLRPSVCPSARSAPIGREPTFGILRSCQREHSDWSRSGPTKRSYLSGKRSILIGWDPADQDTEFFRAFKWIVLIGQEPTFGVLQSCQSLSIGQEVDRRNTPTGWGNG